MSGKSAGISSLTIEIQTGVRVNNEKRRHNGAVSISVEVPEPLASRLAAEATARGVTAEKVALDALTERFGQARRRLGFAAIGASTSGRRAADAEDILAAEGFGFDSADR